MVRWVAISWVDPVFTPDYSVYVACGYDSKHGSDLVIEFSHPSVIEREYTTLRLLKQANVFGVAHVYGCRHPYPFRGTTLQKLSGNLATNGIMKLGRSL